MPPRPVLALHMFCFGMQEQRRLGKGLFIRMCWRATCTFILGAHPSRWQRPSSNGAAPWTPRSLEVLLLRLQSGLHALQAEAVTMPSRFQSGTGWCTSRPCRTFDLSDVCTLSHAGGVQLSHDTTVLCHFPRKGCPDLAAAAVQPRAQRPIFRQLLRTEPRPVTVADRFARPLLARAHLF